MRIKKVGTKLMIIALISILATTTSAVLTMFIGNQIIINDILEADTHTALDALIEKTENDKLKATDLVQSLASDNLLREAILAGDHDEIVESMKVSSSNFSSNTDFIIVLDADGNVLARNYNNEYGDSLINQHSISEAMTGKTASYIESGTDIKLAVCSSTPVLNNQGAIIGIISSGYMLDKESYVDELKETMDVEFTIFLGDIRLNTTILKNGERAVGTPISPELKTKIIDNKEKYMAEADILEKPFYTAYAPILDSEGNAIGIFFAGKPVSTIKSIQLNITLIAFLIVLVIGALAILFNRYISRKIIANPIKMMSQAALSLASGNLSDTNISYTSTDEIGQLSTALQSTVSTLQTYISDISSQLNKIASGDMTSDITQDYIGDFRPIKVSLEKISSSLNQTLSMISASSEQVESGANQVSSASQSLAQGATEQASTIEELSASIQNVLQEVKQNAHNVGKATEYVEQTVDGVNEGNAQMSKMLGSMNEINETSNEIKKIIKVIEDIAFQTNILALNAAVEAARAGNAGKGFAVVADEVRNLATKSANAANQTTALIESSIAAVKTGTIISNETAKALENVSNKSQLIKTLIQDIDKSSNEQAIAISQITQGIEQISSVVQTNSATSEESAAASEELSGQASMLNSEMTKFKLSEKKYYNGISKSMK